MILNGQVKVWGCGVVRGEFMTFGWSATLQLDRGRRPTYRWFAKFELQCHRRGKRAESLQCR